MEKLHHLHGMRDLSQEFWRPLKMAQDRLREFFHLHGYRVLETPILEPTELFLRKSGGELAARTYSFTDPGGNEVSLRPEYTASILRHYLEDITEPLPLRIQYAGPVFRYESDGSSYRQFTQVGAELMGSSSARADAEVLSLSCAALSDLGLSECHLEIGDIRVHHSLLESLGLSGRAIGFILSNIPELKSGQEGLANVRERAIQLRLLASNSRQRDLASAIGDMEEGTARKLLEGLLNWAEVGSLGQREPSEVVERLLRKFRGTDDPKALERGLEIACALSCIKGEPSRCLAEVEKVIESSDSNSAALNRLKEVVKLLEVDHPDGATITLDFGLARGLAYYTGIVFEIKLPSLGTSLGGGGRYDALAKALGSPSHMPALGFAYTLEHVIDTLKGNGVEADPGNETSRVLVLALTSKGYPQALSLARRLREDGKAVEMDVRGMSVDESISYAKSKGFAEVIAVSDDGTSTSYQINERQRSLR